MTSLRPPDELDPNYPPTFAERTEHLLDAVLGREEDRTDRLLSELEAYDPIALDRLAGHRQAALAAWLNLYNAFAVLELRNDPEQFDSKRSFFGDRFVAVAGDRFSLDEIEHGILRARQWKYGLGYLRWPFYRDRVAELALDAVDYRIHFALNCGAASCPIVRPYAADSIDEELGRATEAYLDRVVEYDPDRNVARVPRHCLWYRGDFGGRSGIREMLREHEQVPPETAPGLRYAEYDWSLSID